MSMVDRVRRALNLAPSAEGYAMARAAIMAMREPTDAMVNAVRGSAPYDRDVAETWPIMIDTALKEGPA